VFLNEQAPCLKGSPDSFCNWLLDSNDIANFDDLADALSTQASNLCDVLKSGDGNIGVKGFMLAMFQNAVILQQSL
jgi:hypothetical protein